MPERTGPSEERKLATVLFADLVGSTELAGSQDPERTRALLNRFYDAMASEISDVGAGEHLIEECSTLDLSVLVPELRVPLTVGVGRHDLVNATEVTMDWFAGVRAPSKRLHVFEQSAHFPNFCEPEAFQALVAESTGG